MSEGDRKILEMSALEDEKRFDREWEKFEGKDLMNREEFNSRLTIIRETEEIEWEYLDRGKHVFLFNSDIRYFIDPHNCILWKQKSTYIPCRDFVNISQYILETLPANKKLVVSSRQTFITDKDSDF